MNLILIRILFFCLIPFGIFLLIKAIKIFRKTFYGKVILEIPYLQKEGQFSVKKVGRFSIWQKGEVLKKTPINKFKFHIYEESTKEEIKLQLSILRPKVNSFSTGKMELYRFYAPIGNYKIIFKEKNNISKLENLVEKIVPFQSVELSKYFIEIRESQSQIITILAIPMLLLGLFGAIGGLMFGIFADLIFK